MEFTAKQIAQFVQGHIEGDENAIVNTFAKLKKVRKVLFLSSQIPNIRIMYTTLSRLSY